MLIPVPFIRPQTLEEPPAFVRIVSRGDVTWNRRVFRAPPIEVPTPTVTITPRFSGAVKLARRDPA